MLVFQTNYLISFSVTTLTFVTGLSYLIRKVGLELLCGFAVQMKLVEATRTSNKYPWSVEI